MQTVARTGGVIATFPFLSQVSRYIKIPVISNAAENRNRMIQYADESLQRHHRISEEEGDNAKPTLFSKLYKTTSDGDLSVKELRDNAVSYIVAGSDTTVSYYNSPERRLT